MMTKPHSYKHDAPVKNTSRHMTMSDIAEGLRQVHRHMQRKHVLSEQMKAPVAKPVYSEVKEINTRLDEISRAILADYQERRAKQDQMLVLLSALHNEVKQRQNSSTSEQKDPVSAKELEAIFHRIQSETKTMVSSSYEELSRQIRETTAAARHSQQLAALEQQLNTISHQLHTSNTHESTDKNNEKDALSQLFKKADTTEGQPKQQTFDAAASVRMIALARQTQKQDK